MMLVPNRDFDLFDDSKILQIDSTRENAYDF